MTAREATRRFAVPALLTLALSVPASAPSAFAGSAEDPPVGAEGVVRTVVEGTRPVDVPVRFLGRYPDAAAPGFDLLLVELLGPIGEEVGVAAGMSGSPVYHDGRLIGALAYRFGFHPKRAVGGVTPIEDLRAAAAAGSAEGSRAAPASVASTRAPLRFSASHPDVRVWLEGELAARGLASVHGAAAVASAGDASVAGWRAEPGAPVGFVLVRGDWLAGATGTVTAIEDGRVFAFGHPVLGIGRVRVPMTTASVVHTLSDALGSVRLTRIGETVGRFEDDRLTATVGSLDAEAAMLPLSVAIRGDGYGSKTFRFEVARELSIAPLLAGAAVSNVLTTHPGYENRQTMLGTFRVRWDDGRELERHFAGAGERIRVPASVVAVEVQRLLRDAWVEERDVPPPAAVEVDLSVTRERLEYTLADVRFPRRPAAPGDVVTLDAILESFDGVRVRHALDVKLPARAPAGDRWTLRVGAAPSVDRATGEGAEARRPGESRDAWLRRTRSVGSAADLDVRAITRGARWRGAGATRGALPGTAARLLDGATAATHDESLARIRLDGPVRGSRAIEIPLKETP